MATTPLRRPRLSAAPTALLLAGVLLLATSVPVAAAPNPATTAEALIRGWLNHDRIAAGLAPLRADHDLAVIAGRRATRMASANVMSHTISGSLGAQLRARGVQWYGYGENIGWSNAKWAKSAASMIYSMWKASPSHHRLMMSNKMNYIGVGLALRSSNRRAFASMVLTESRDHTGARATLHPAGASGNDVSWSWTGADVRLQTHTAGLRDFDVQYRVGSGAWRMIRNNTDTTSFTAADRGSGSWYGLRVRATDRRGNIGPWTAERRVYVP